MDYAYRSEVIIYTETLGEILAIANFKNYKDQAPISISLPTLSGEYDITSMIRPSEMKRIIELVEKSSVTGETEADLLVANSSAREMKAKNFKNPEVEDLCLI